MDSRPQDTFNPPESAIVDDGTRVSEEAFESEGVVSSAHGTTSGEAVETTMDLSDDLESELANLLSPDLDAMDLDEPVAEARPSRIPDDEPHVEDPLAVTATDTEPSDQTSVAPPADTSIAAAPDASVVAAAEAIAEAAARTAEAIDVAEAVEPGTPAMAASFEEALEAQDIEAAGFEAAVRGAAGRSSSRFLFQMPVHTVPDCQRVAAVNLAGTETPVTVLVLLRSDGRSVRMEDARASDNPFAGMAVSYGGLLAHLKSLPTRSAA